jgi:hypothetical protein
MNMINVVVIRANVIAENKLFTDKKAVANAERCFKQYVTSIIGAPVIKEIMDFALDEGYYEGPETCVCISEPEVIK